VKPSFIASLLLSLSDSCLGGIAVCFTVAWEGRRGHSYKRVRGPYFI